MFELLLLVATLLLTMSKQVSQLFEIKGLVAAAFTPFNNDGYVEFFCFCFQVYYHYHNCYFIDSGKLICLLSSHMLTSCCSKRLHTFLVSKMDTLQLIEISSIVLILT